MPFLMDDLLQQMAGNTPPNIRQRTDGLLIDQSVGRNSDLPVDMPAPPLTLQEPRGWPVEEQFPLLPSGDVVPLGRPPGPFQGPTNQSSDYMLGRQTDPKVAPVNPSPEFWQQWMNRQLNRKKMNDMGVPYG